MLKEVFKKRSKNVTIKITDTDLGWKRIQMEMKKFRKLFTDIGHFSDSRYGDGTSVALIAAVNEFGTNHAGRNRKVKIPERSWKRSVFDKNINRIWRVIEQLISKILTGQLTAEKAIAQLGEWWTGMEKDSITNLTSPPNAPITIRKKGSSNPLIDTGQMRNSIDHKESA